MKKADAIIAAFFAVVSPRLAATQQAPVTTAFVNVNVLTMTEERVASAQTVLVEGGRIVRVGASSDVSVPADAIVIDGEGDYLLPGLTDAHVHLPTGMPWAPTRDDFGDAPIYLSYGVTTVVNLGGSPVQLDWRRKIETGEWLGPTIYSAGPFVNEPRVTTPEEVAQDIAAQAKDGFDLIKFHELPQTTTGLSAAAYRRMIEAASQAHLPLIGHAPVNLGLDEMLAAHQNIAHVGMLSEHLLPAVRVTSQPRWSTSGVAAFLVIVIAALAMMAKLVRRIVEEVPRLPRDHSRRQLETDQRDHGCGDGCRGAGGDRVSSRRSAVRQPASPHRLHRPRRRRRWRLSDGDRPVLYAVWPTSNASLVAKLHVLTVAAAGSVLSVLLFIFWIPVAWRSSEAGIDRLAERLHDAGIFVQSTLVVYESLSADRRVALSAEPAVDLLLPSTRDAWRQSASEQPAPRLFRLLEFMQKVIEALHRHDVPIMAGTDAMGIELIAPGSSLHRELQFLFSSGLSPYRSLAHCDGGSGSVSRQESGVRHCDAGATGRSVAGQPQSS